MTYGAASSEFNPLQMESLSKASAPASIQSHGRLSFDQYCLLAKKIYEERYVLLVSASFLTSPSAYGNP